MTNKPIQLNLFNRPTLNVVRPVKRAMNEDVRACGLSREQIVDKMNDLAVSYSVGLVNGSGKQLTIDTFEKWLNLNEPTRNIPFKAVPIFCAAVGRCSVLDAIAQPLHLRVVGEREQKLIRLAEAKLAIKEKNRLVRKIEAEL